MGPCFKIVPWVWTSTLLGVLNYTNKCSSLEFRPYILFLAHSGIQRQRAGQGVWTPPPWKINLSNIGLDHPEKLQLCQASIRCWAITSTPWKHHLNGVLLAGQWWPTFSGIWILSSTKTKQKNVKIGPSLTKLSGSAYVVLMLCFLDCIIF